MITRNQKILPVVPRAVSEAALAHVVENKVEAAYHRTDHFEKRRILMGHWAAHCYGLQTA